MGGAATYAGAGPAHYSAPLRAASAIATARQLRAAQLAADSALRETGLKISKTKQFQARPDPRSSIGSPDLRLICPLASAVLTPRV